LLAPITIARGESERTLIEASVNCVRISVCVKKGQEIEHLLTAQIAKFLQLRADKFEVLRRMPAHENYDFSFLISTEHLQKYKKEELINFILEFIAGIEKEINEMKLAVTNSARFATNFFQNALVNNKI
jgi:actin related protein 2/3 complex subunit 4